ncbi:hypothetical protein CTE07_02220 [Chitinophaga terrae (ex Kim and Jung 2007)]|nr:hypothetical protein CTE07_02220 [Chitinophaga terrae (ex Kim and Jung 2007)]
MYYYINIYQILSDEDLDYHGFRKRQPVKADPGAPAIRPWKNMIAAASYPDSDKKEMLCITAQAKGLA